MKKVIEYAGEETPRHTLLAVSEFLGAGDYRVSIFADGNMIGDRPSPSRSNAPPPLRNPSMTNVGAPTKERQNVQ